MKKEFESYGIEALLVTTQTNQRYLTGFTGTTSRTIVLENQLIFITDGRYTSQAQKEVKNAQIIIVKTTYDAALKDVLETYQIQHLGFEGDDLSYNIVEFYKTYFSQRLIATRNIVEQQRMFKKDDEMMAIQKAVDIADDVFKDTIRYIQKNIHTRTLTEKAVAAYLEQQLIFYGASGPSFETIIASGERSSLPHGVASSKIIKENEPITFDFGAVYNGYVSDMTRTVYVGEPDPTFLELHTIVREAMECAISKIQIGVRLCDIDKAARTYIEEKGFGAYFIHGTGHGIGLDIHEAPTVGPYDKRYLEEGMVITIEPGIYLEGKYGVRIEQDVQVTKSGGKILNSSDTTCKNIMTWEV